MRRFVSFGPALVVLVTVVVVLVVTPALVRSVQSAQTAGRIVLARQVLEDDDILERLNRATRAVADSVRPSVVHIDAAPSGERRWVRSSGSGWVFDGSGHIVTNAHVVRGAERLRVQFSDGRIVEPEPIRGEPFLADPFTDIAVIKVRPGDHIVPALRAGGVMPRQGERVFAFGSPFGFRFSMSEGIIGGVGRDPQTANDFGGYTNYIQHDAAVNPGNSGGPLVDIRGRVIGMNVAIATGANSQGTTGEGQSAGISFAIPLGTIESVVTQLIESGEVSRGFMGIQWQARGDAAIQFHEEIRTTGIQVLSVETEGPADRAGLQSGDVITEFAGMPVTNFAVLRSLITSSRPGQTVPLRVFREGRPMDLSVTLGQMPQRVLLAQARVAEGFVGFGLIVRDGTAGPIIRDVLDESAAQRAGFKREQLIVAIGPTPVRSFEEAQAAAVQQGLLVGRRVSVRVSETDENGTTTERELVMRLRR